MIKISAPKGTKDLLPKDSHKQAFVENLLMEITKKNGFKELRTPVFESTELFSRGVGGTTDVVQKEMYTFNDKGGRSITLRPEGTAGAVRSVIEHGLLNEALPLKISYLTSCYRYERPQAGRLREFHQIGVECFGSSSPAADAEVITMARSFFDAFELDGISLEINSIGCPECRKKYHEALKEYFGTKRDELCEDCLNRLESNPMRLLDCKKPHCKELAEHAPIILDYLCEECSEHFNKVKTYLDACDVPYVVNPKIVRGLDYYTKTVFEFVSDEIGAQGTVLGGGRYDGLVEQLGGKPAPALGFAMGLERFMLLLEAKKYKFEKSGQLDLYIANLGEAAHMYALGIADALRTGGYTVEIDLMERGLKAQLKYANKIGAAYTVVIGEDDIEKDSVSLKNMETGETTEIKVSEFEERFNDEYIKNSAKELFNNLSQLDVQE